MKHFILGVLLSSLYSAYSLATVNVIPKGNWGIERGGDIYGESYCEGYKNTKTTELSVFKNGLKTFFEHVYANEGITKQENVLIEDLGVYLHDQTGVTEALTKRVTGFIAIAKKLNCTAFHHTENPSEFMTLQEGCDFSKLSSTIEWLYGFKIYMYEGQSSSCFKNQNHNIFTFMPERPDEVEE